MAKGETVDNLQARCLRLGFEFAAAGQEAAWKNVLLNKVCAQGIALKQGVVDHNALDTGLTAGLEQTCDGLEIGRPIGAANGFDHFNGTNRVVGAVVGIAVVLQAQVGMDGLGAKSLAGIGQLRGTEGDARHLGAKFASGNFGQAAPATAYLQHALTRACLHARHAQSTSHFGVLRGLQVLAGVVVKPSRGVRHAGV